MTQKLLITGGSGFIGRHCLAPAIAAGFEVWATTSSKCNDYLRPSITAINWEEIDLLKPDSIESLLNRIKPTYLLHTAWETNHGTYWTSPANLDWLSLGSRLFKSFAEVGGKRLVCAGSCAEYDWHSGYMTEDITPEHPSSFYGRIKLAHHNTMMASAEQFGFSAATGRVFFLYGCYENLNRVVPYACKQLAVGKHAEFSSGLYYRDYMYVEDVANAFIALLQSDIHGVCNISTGIPRTLAEIVITIGSVAERPDLIQLGKKPDRENEPPMIVGDNTKLRSIGWLPTYSLENGIKQTFDWFSSIKTMEKYNVIK